MSKPRKCQPGFHLGPFQVLINGQPGKQIKCKNCDEILSVPKEPR